jgi:plasmid stability protein
VAQVLIRDLPDDVVERLKAKASANGRSLEAHLRVVLEEASTYDRSELLAIAERIAERSRGRPQTDSADIIRQSRDANWE